MSVFDPGAPENPPDAESADESPLSRGSTRRGRWLLALLLAGSTALRLWHGLGTTQYWDEEFSLANARSILWTDELTPVTGYYPLLSYLPVAGVSAGIDWARKISGLEGEAPALILQARVVQTIYGTLALLVLYAFGRRLFGEAAALLAVAAAGFSDYDIVIWGYFKPDALMAFATLLALLLSLAACRRPTIARFALAGLGIALAMSAKVTGGVAAVSLAIGAIALPLALGRRLALLAVAGASTVACFLVLNPHWRTNVEYLSIVSSLYQSKDHGSGRAEGLRTLVVEFLPQLRGPAVAVLFAVGCLWLGVRLFREERDTEAAIGGRIALSYPFAFTLVYFAATPHFQGNNFSPVVPLVFLLAAAPATAAWAACRKRWRAPALGALGWLVALALGATWAATACSSVYRRLVPETDDLATRVIEQSLTEGGTDTPRLVYVETVAHALPYWQFRSALANPRWALAEVGRLDAVSVEERELADALVSPLLGRPPDRSAARRAPQVELPPLAGEARRTAILPVPFRARGPALLFRERTWELAGPLVTLHSARSDPFGEPEGLHVSSEGGIAASLPSDLPPGSVVSFEVWVPFPDLDRAGVPELEVGDRRLTLHWSGRDGKGHRFVSPRLALSTSHQLLALRAPHGEIHEAELILARWKPARSE